MFVNPWTYYIVNDEMPDTGTLGLGDKFRNRVLWSLVYAFVVFFLWATVVVLGSKYLIGYGSKHYMLKFCLLIFPSLALMVFLLIFGMNKILDVKEKEKVKENNNVGVMKNEKKAKEIAEKNGKLKMYFNGFELDGVGFDASPECYDSAMEMAKWKDEQYKELIKMLVDELNTSKLYHLGITGLDTDAEIAQKRKDGDTALIRGIERTIKFVEESIK